MSSPDRTAQRAVLERVGSLERERAVLFAKQARAHAEMAVLWGEDPGVLLELAGTARMGQGRAGGLLGRDERLVTLFPVALGLLELGVMRVATVEILLAVSKNCTAPVQQLLDERLAERVCQLDAVDARRLIAQSIPELEAELDPAAQHERLEQARANRGVWAHPVEDGMARIGAELDQVSARRWSLDFEELVRAQKVIDDRDGVKRTQAQRRADVFAQLPSRLLALADAAARGRLQELLAQVAAERATTGSSAIVDALLSDTPGAQDATAQDVSAQDATAQDATAQDVSAQDIDTEAANDDRDSEVDTVVVGTRDVCTGDVDTGDVDGDEVVDGQCTGLVPAPRTAGQSLVDELPLGPAPRPPCQWWELDREELLIGLLRLPVRNPVMLNVHIPMTTLLDLDQRSGWLEGFGSVPALHARMLLPITELRRVAVDPVTGVPLGLDPLTGPLPPWPGELDPPDHGQHQPQRLRPPRPRAADIDGSLPDPARPEALGSIALLEIVAPSAVPATAETAAEAGAASGRVSVPSPSSAQVQRRRLLEMLGRPMYLTDRAEPQHDPSTALREQARVRDQLCDGPGCPRTAGACELDHELDFALGGQTALWNLRHRSTRCHHRKHDVWTVEHDPSTAISTWTSPTGSVYERRSPWQPPLELAADLVLPEPRLVHPIDLPPDRYDAGSEWPLWREPEPPQPRQPRKARGIDLDRINEDGSITPLPTPRPPSTSNGWGDDDPPPF